MAGDDSFPAGGGTTYETRNIHRSAAATTGFRQYTVDTNAKILTSYNNPDTNKSRVGKFFTTPNEKANRSQQRTVQQGLTSSQASKPLQTWQQAGRQAGRQHTRGAGSHLGRPQSVGRVSRPDLVHHAAPLEGGARLKGRRVPLLAPGLDVVYRPQGWVLGPDGVYDTPVDHLFREDRVRPVPQSEGAERQRALVWCAAVCAGIGRLRATLVVFSGQKGGRVYRYCSIARETNMYFV